MALENDRARRKGGWTEVEDMKLVEYINKHGVGNWKSVAKAAGLDRTEKSCRLRWANHLRPDIKKGAFSEEEKQLIMELHAQLGSKWSRISAQLPGRTDNEIKNFWNGRLRRKRPEALTLDNNEEHQPKQQLNLPGPSSFSSLVSTSYPLNNLYSPSHSDLLNTQKNQPVPVSTYMNHHLEHFQSNNKDPFLKNGFSDSVPMPSMVRFGPRNCCVDSHPNVEQPLIHSLPGFTPTPTTTSDWFMTSNGTITSMENDDKDINIYGEGITNVNVMGDELMSLLNSSSSSEPLPEWSELGY